VRPGRPLGGGRAGRSDPENLPRGGSTTSWTKRANTRGASKTECQGRSKTECQGRHHGTFLAVDVSISPSFPSPVGLTGQCFVTGSIVRFGGGEGDRVESATRNRAETVPGTSLRASGREATGPLFPSKRKRLQQSPQHVSGTFLSMGAVRAGRLRGEGRATSHQHDAFAQS
jgi:hypothetical protein